MLAWDWTELQSREDTHWTSLPARVSYDLGSPRRMWQRGREDQDTREGGDEYAALEDIFSLKLIANRPRDIEDCIVLATAKMDFEVIYSEIEAQYARSGTIEEKIWITYLEEGIGKLEEDYQMQVPIADRVSDLANEYRERLYQKLKPG